MDIVSRAQWGAQHEAGDGPAPLPAREVWLHHSVTIAPDLVPPFDDEDAAMRVLEQIGESRFGRGVSYTFAIMPTGRVYEGHGVSRLGAHTAKRNGIARAIVLVGNYDVNSPTGAQVESAAQLLVDGYCAGWWTQARLSGGHQQAPGASTACPGRYAMAVIPDINRRAQELLAGATPDTDEDELMSKADDILAELAKLREQIAFLGLEVLRSAPDQGGTGAMAIASRQGGWWWDIPSGAYWDLYTGRGWIPRTWQNLAPNEYNHRRLMLTSSEQNDDAALAAIRALSEDEARRAAERVEPVGTAT